MSNNYDLNDADSLFSIGSNLGDDCTTRHGKNCMVRNLYKPSSPALTLPLPALSPPPPIPLLVPGACTVRLIRQITPMFLCTRLLIYLFMFMYIFLRYFIFRVFRFFFSFIIFIFVLFPQGQDVGGPKTDTFMVIPISVCVCVSSCRQRFTCFPKQLHVSSTKRSGDTGAIELFLPPPRPDFYPSVVGWNVYHGNLHLHLDEINRLHLIE